MHAINDPSASVPHSCRVVALLAVFTSGCANAAAPVGPSHVAAAAATEPAAEETPAAFLDRFEGALCAGVGDPLAVFDPQSEAVAACTGTTTAAWYSRVREEVCAPGTTREVTMLGPGSGSAVWARERHRYTLGLARTDGRWGFDRDITPEACAVAQREGYFVLNYPTAFVPATLYVGERAYPIEAGAFENTFLWGAGSSDPLRLEVPQVREIPLEFDRIDESGRAHVQERALAPSTASRFTLDAGSLTSFRVGRSAPEGIHMTDLSLVSRGGEEPGDAGECFVESRLSASFSTFEGSGSRFQVGHLRCGDPRCDGAGWSCVYAPEDAAQVAFPIQLRVFRCPGPGTLEEVVPQRCEPYWDLGTSAPLFVAPATFSRRQ